MDSTVLFEKVFKETKDIRNKLDNMSEEDSKKFMNDTKRRQAISTLVNIVLRNVQSRIKESSELGYTRTSIYSNIRSYNRKMNGYYVGWLMHNKGFLAQVRRSLNPFTVFTKSFSNNESEDVEKDILFVSWGRDRREYSKNIRGNTRGNTRSNTGGDSTTGDSTTGDSTTGGDTTEGDTTGDATTGDADTTGGDADTTGGDADTEGDTTEGDTTGGNADQ